MWLKVFEAETYMSNKSCSGGWCTVEAATVHNIHSELTFKDLTKSVKEAHGTNKCHKLFKRVIYNTCPESYIWKENKPPDWRTSWLLETRVALSVLYLLSIQQMFQNIIYFYSIIKEQLLCNLPWKVITAVIVVLLVMSSLKASRMKQTKRTHKHYKN